MKLGANYVPAPAAVPSLAARAALHQTVPQAVDWLRSIPADGDALGNDQYSNCWEVAQAWVICLRRARVAGDFTRPDRAKIMAQYSALTGFVEPADDMSTAINDNGTDTAAAMAAWVSNGVRVNDQTEDVPHWLTVDPANDVHLAIALLAGPLMTTWHLPMAMQDPFAWSRAPGSSSDWTTLWGGHEVALGATDARDAFTVRTWGMDLLVHPEIRRRYCVGVDIPLDLSPGGWLDTVGRTPTGLDRASLELDMKMLG